MNKAKTPKEFFNKVNTFLTENIDFLYQLRDRWENECEYENFNNYKVIIVKKLKNYGLISDSITKSFTIKFIYETNYIIELKLPKNGRVKIAMHHI